MSKFACPERRLSCGKGRSRTPCCPRPANTSPIGDPEGDRVTSEIDPPYVSLERPLGFEACWFWHSPAFSARAGSQPGLFSGRPSSGSQRHDHESATNLLAPLPRQVFYRNWGGKRYSVIAKIRYTISTSTPTNHAERPLLVNRNAVTVEMSIITTAPGQNCKFIGAGAIT